MDWWAGLEVRIHADLETLEVIGKEKALVMPNHTCDADVLMMWLLAERFNCLRGALMVMKKSSKYLPIYGWANWFNGAVFLDRNWAKDEGKLKSSFQELKDFPISFWLTIFVEGTRMTPDKLLAAQEFAISKGFPVPRNVLIPRTKDAMLDKFRANGTFDGKESRDLRIPPKKSLIVVILLSCIDSIGAILLIRRFSLLSNWKGISSLAFAVAFDAILMYTFIEYTKLPEQGKVQARNGQVVKLH